MYKLFAYALLSCFLILPALQADVSKHRVRKGETLTEIAAAYNVSVSAIKSANQISNANRIKVGQILSIPAAAPTFVEYKIRKGDSLAKIAEKYGTSVKSITQANGIRNANRIKIGQEIKIPVPAGHSIPGSAVAGPQLSSRSLAALARTTVKANRWKHIVIHHSASDTGSAKAFDRFHREERRMENGLAYHFVIGNGRGMGDGELAIGKRWTKQIQGGHLSSHALNQISIGICLVGDFSKRRPTKKQMETLEALLRQLMAQTRLPPARVTTHTLIHPKHTLCPGKYFPTSQLRGRLASKPTRP